MRLKSSILVNCDYGKKILLVLGGNLVGVTDQFLEGSLAKILNAYKVITECQFVEGKKRYHMYLYFKMNNKNIITFYRIKMNVCVWLCTCKQFNLKMYLFTSVSLDQHSSSIAQPNIQSNIGLKFHPKISVCIKIKKIKIIVIFVLDWLFTFSKL